MKTLDFVLDDGTLIRAEMAIPGTSWLRLWAAYIVTPGRHAIACNGSSFLRLSLADVNRVYLDESRPPTLAWRRDNPDTSVRDLRWIIRLHFEVPAGR